MYNTNQLGFVAQLTTYPSQGSYNKGVGEVFTFDLTGGHPALDLANTISRRDDPQRRAEHLNSYADLVAFAVQSDIISPKQAQEIRHYSERHGSEGKRLFRSVILFRESLYRAFAAIAKGSAPATPDLRAINQAAISALRHRELKRVNGGYRWEWKNGVHSGAHSLERILWPIAQAAADLLTSGDLKLVRWCEAADCEWLFLDRSRNRSRRWCDMTSCGNRAKARRHYQRARQ